MDLIPESSDYGSRALNSEDLKADPIELFKDWLAKAVDADCPEVNAVCVSTLDEHGFPDARMVLLKGIDPRGFHFYTNYQSHKGQQIDHHPKASMVFWWEPLKRQVRIKGTIEKLETEVSDSYFASRSRGSQIGAWASLQSQAIEERGVLEARIQEMEERFPDEVPRPDYWGGYRVIPQRIEFWQGRTSRLHDRFVYQKQDEQWTIERLMP